MSCPCLDPQESHLQCRLVQEDSDPPAGVPWKGSPFKKREPEASAARAMGSRSGVKGQKYGNSVPPLTLRGLGPALWSHLGSASPQTPEASWLSLQHPGFHWGGGGVLKKEEQRYPREPLVLASNPREEIAPFSL